MKLTHDIENDLEHTIPAEGGWDTHWLFEAMTQRSFALLELANGDRVMDQACGMGQDTLAVAKKVSLRAGGKNLEAEGPGFALGLEPSGRMIRFAQHSSRGKSVEVAARPRFVRGLAEEMPFRGGSFDAVLCKGAMDHFENPRLAMEEIARVLMPGGRAVLAIANYDSLSCRLGRWLDWTRRKIEAGYLPPEHPYHQPPPDHLTRFGYRSVLSLVPPSLRLSRVEGISMLWGFPPWSRLVERLSPRVRALARTAAFALGRVLPFWSDVIVVQAVRKP